MNACRFPSMTGVAPMRGFSLLELLIALTISLLITAAVGYVYISSLQAYRTQGALSRLQEGARYAFEFLGKDVRMTGASGCAFSTSANALNTPTDWYKDLFGRPLQGTNDTLAGDACTAWATPCLVGTDTLTGLLADISREYIVQSHNTGGAPPQITLDTGAGLSAGQLLVATDCSHAAVFQATGVTGAVVEHAASGTPGNATANLGVGGAVYSYPAGSRVYPLKAATYYIGTNPAGEPALYRLVPQGANATPTAEELVEGVEDMQVTYGVDTTVPADGEVDFVDPDGDGDPYLTAAQVESGSVPGLNNDERWQRVVSVRVSLLMRTSEDGVVPASQTYAFNGATVTPADRRLRKVFTHVIKLRNR